VTQPQEDQKLHLKFVQTIIISNNKQQALKHCLKIYYGAITSETKFLTSLCFESPSDESAKYFYNSYYKFITDPFSFKKRVVGEIVSTIFHPTHEIVIRHLTKYSSIDPLYEKDNFFFM